MAHDHRKHVLYITYHLPTPEQPGAFRPWMEARLMAKAGFKVSIVTSGVQYMTGKDTRPENRWCTRETRDGIEIFKTWAPVDYRKSIRSRILNYASFSILGMVVSLAKVKKADFVFVGTDPITMMPFVFVTSLIKRATLILDERDLYPESAIALGVIQEGLFTRLILRMQNFFRRHAKGILTAAPGIENQMLFYGHPKDKVFMLYNADVYFDEDFETPAQTSDYAKETGKSFLVGYCGGLGLANDIMTFLLCAKNCRQIPEMGFFIFGSGERKNDYVEFCRANGIDNVFFYEAMPRKEVRHSMKQMDVCVQPLPDKEVFHHIITNKTFDYHGLGKPMVYSGYGVTRELISMSGGGISVTPEKPEEMAEAIRLLFQDEAKRKEMGKNAREWFETHINPEVACDIMRKVIDK